MDDIISISIGIGIGISISISISNPMPLTVRNPYCCFARKIHLTIKDLASKDTVLSKLKYQNALTWLSHQELILY